MQLKIFIGATFFLVGCARSEDTLPDRGYPLLLSVEGTCTCAYTIYQEDSVILSGYYDCTQNKVVQERLRPGLYQIQANTRFGREKVATFEKTAGIQELTIVF